MKESEDVEGLRTTCGDPARADAPVAVADSSQVAALRAAGAIVVGKTNVPPYVVMASASNALFGTTRNPWNLQHGPGGSSGGTAAALALGLVPLATGSDGGGSIRIPSACCGIAGFKPTTGVVAIADPDPYVWGALDTRSVMARTFDDIALALDVVAGPSTRDPYSVAVDGSFVEAVRQPSLAGLRVGWSAGLGYGATDPAILAACERALRAMEGAGAIVEEITAGPLDSNPSLDWVTLIAPETARRALAVSDDLTRFDDAVRFTIEFGLGVTSTRLAEAESNRRRVLASLADVYDRYDILASPTVEGLPPFVTDDAADWVGYTYVFNLASVPAATVPVGFAPADGGDLPVGLQLSGPRLMDLRVFAAAAATATALSNRSE